MTVQPKMTKSGELYVLPPDFDTLEFGEVLEWYATKVLELDEENQRLKAKVAEYERGKAIQTRAGKPANPAKHPSHVAPEGPGPIGYGLPYGPGFGQRPGDN